MTKHKILTSTLNLFNSQNDADIAAVGTSLHLDLTNWSNTAFVIMSDIREIDSRKVRQASQHSANKLRSLNGNSIMLHLFECH